MGKSAINAPRGNLFYLPPEDLHLVTKEGDPLYDERVNMPLPESLIRSIQVRGVIEPVVVRKDGERVVVVDGRQRVRAAREANKRLEREGAETIRVPVILKKADDAEAASVMVLLNEIRFADSVITKAKKAKRLADLGRSEDELAEVFGVSKSTIANWMALLDLAPKAQAAVESGTVRVADAVRELARLPRDEQPAALLKLEAERPTRLSRKARGEKPNGKRPLTPARRLQQLETFLDEHPGSLPESPMVLLTWLRGGISDKSLAFTFGGLTAMFETTKAKRKETR
jgi:ParB family chromosome partitioning protein